MKMLITLFLLLLNPYCEAVIQLPSNVSVPFIFEADESDIQNESPYYTDENSYMEEEDKIYPRKWRVQEDGEEEPNLLQSLEDEGFVVYEIDGNRRPTDKIFGHFTRYNNSYLILAPLIARPNSVYRLVVLVYRVDDPSKDITVRASLSTSTGNELTYSESNTMVYESIELMMKLPGSLPGPKLKLRVEAQQGSNLLFVNTTLIHPSTDFLTIVVYLSRPAFCQDQKVSFRVILMTNEMLPYQDPVDVFILDPTGYIVKRWVSRIPNTGLIDLDFFTPSIPLAGFWRVRVKAKSQIKEHPFLVISYYIPRFEIMYDFNAFTLASEESISGAVETYVTNDAIVFGNMTLTLWAKYPATAHDSHYKEITTEHFDNVDGSDGSGDFEFPMSLLEGHVPNLVGTEIKIETSFMDHYTGMTVYGYAKTRIISGEVTLKFIGPSPVIFRPGMPLTLSVQVAYDDLERIDPEDLVSSSLRITATSAGGRGGTIPEIYIPPESEDITETENLFSANDNHLLNDSLFGKGMVRGGLYGRTYYRYDSLDSYDENEIWLRNARYKSLLARETYFKKQQYEEFRNTGIFTFTIEIPKDATTLTVNAAYIDGEGTTAGGKIEGVANFHPKGRNLHVTTSTQKGVIGENAVFHVRTNFPLLKFHYVVLSKSIIVHSASEEVPFAGAEGVATLAVPVSRDMFPLMTFVAYHVDQNGDTTADFIKIPVESPSVFEASLDLNEHKDHSKRTVEGIVYGASGTYYAISCAREISYTLQPTSRLTIGRFIEEALAQEPLPRTISKVDIQPRNRADPATVHLLTSGDTEGDVRRTLQASGLTPLSDKRFHSSSPSLGNCETSLGLLECGDGTCYQMQEVCNGVFNCKDGSDEMQCNYQYVPTRSNEEGIPEVKVYLLLRMSWWKDLFDTEDGEFAWAGQLIDHGDNEQLGLEIPRTQDSWIIEGVAVHPTLGIAFVEPQMFTSDPPVFLVLEGPTICRRGEQVSIRTAVFNSMDYRQAVLLVLPESEDYKFVFVEEKGIVSSFNPRLSTGEHQHVIFIPPGGIKEVFFPFAIQKQVGTVEIVIQMRSPIASDEESWEIEVKPEGAPVYKHTSVLLDLKSRAQYYEFLNIPIDESPVIKNSLLRRFVAGSPQASLTISGDVFGPTTEDISVDFDNAYKGRYFKSTDGLAFNFGATVWTLHYLRLTNQLNIDEATGAFDFLNVQMAGILTRMINGGFKMWHYSGPSVWLTAWVTSILQKAMFEEWEDLIYIDPRVLADSVNFMLQYQNPRGDFRETEFYNVTLDYKYRYQSKTYTKDVALGLTALVTATIREVVDSLPGKTRQRANQALIRAQRFLEKSLSSLRDPYDIAITAWALNVIGSTEKDVAVSKLLQIVRAEEGFLYWSRDKIKSNTRIFENSQRNFLQPKEPQEWDASAIEGTSYALLVLLSQEGVTVREERIVNWLVSVRDWDFAFDATVDSIIAFRALTEYCYRARLRDVTDLKVDVETSADYDFKEQIRIEQPFVSAMQALEIPNAWGHVHLTGRGAGQALAQLTTTWGVDVPGRLERPPRKYFDLSISEYHHQARNKSRITTTVCTRWTATDFTPTSHAAMIEVEVPTGYFLHLPEANQVARKAIENGNFPELKDAMCTEAYIFFQFSHIPSYQQCFSYDLHRWHPVANLTRTRSAKVLELFAPEHFEHVILNTTTLSALDVCEVCGSYQCPYCYFYSSSEIFRVSFTLMIISFTVTQNCISLYDSLILPLSLIFDLFYRRIS